MSEAHGSAARPQGERTTLYEFALLALALAHGTDDHLSAFELESLADRLYLHHMGWSREEVQSVVQDALHTYTASPDRWERARQAGLLLAHALDADAREQALNDLLLIARADGVVLESERQFVAKIAAFWNATSANLPGGWTLLHDLAYLYLALALGADDDLSGDELARIRHAIASGPLAPPDPGAVGVIVREALQFYTTHSEPSTRESVAARLGEALGEAQRQAVLASLVELANADDRFLDAEEDLLNGLAMAWDVDPGALFDPPALD